MERQQEELHRKLVRNGEHKETTKSCRYTEIGVAVATVMRRVPWGSRNLAEIQQRLRVAK